MRQPGISSPSGGGQCFFMDPPADDPTRWVAMEAYLRSVPSLLPARPDFLLGGSALWEIRQPPGLPAPQPSHLFRSYNFPPRPYRLTHPPPRPPQHSAPVPAPLGPACI